jgi:single-strand DNA-binding protein
MSGSVNKVILVGNLGRDPEVRRTGNGDPIVSFSVATAETWKDKATGERKERTEWHNVTIFNEALGKIAEQYCKKGSKVYLEGQLQTREYTDKDGNQRKATEVVLQRYRGELTLLDGRSRDGGGGGDDRVGYGGGQSSGGGGGGYSRPAAGGGRPAQVGSGGGGGRSDPIDDDIPF